MAEKLRSSERVAWLCKHLASRSHQSVSLPKFVKDARRGLVLLNIYDSRVLATNVEQKISSVESRVTLIVTNFWQLSSQILGKTSLIVTDIERNPMCKKRACSGNAPQIFVRITTQYL